MSQATAIFGSNYRTYHTINFINPSRFANVNVDSLKESVGITVKPSSETLAYSIFAKWITSYRNLPLKVNFWNSALRAEIKSTKPLIRTSEFLWQEGHTVHSTEEEAEQEVMTILDIYKDFIENYLAVPVIAGYKTDS